jgi:CRP/FNR family transcriptional regulator
MYRSSVSENASRLGQRPNACADRGPPPIKTVFAGKPAETFSAGEAVFWEGDKAADLFWIAAGHVQLYKTLNDGRRVVIGFLFPNELLGLSFANEFLVSGEALTALKLLRIPRRQFHEIINRSPSLQLEVSRLVSASLEAANDHVLLLARMNAEERVSRFILDIYRRSAVDAEILLPMKRSDIADYLGLTVETVSRGVAGLKRKGLIETGRLGQSVKVLQLRSLSEIAQMNE